MIERSEGRTFRTMVTLTPIKDQDGKVRRIMSMCESARRRRTMMDRLYIGENFDGLTGLPNRAHIVSVLQDAITGGIHTGDMALSRMTILAVDIDGFTQTNNSLGSEMGDLLLCEVSKRIKGVLRGHDHLARVGSDSFLAILLHADQEQARVVIDRINERLAIPYVLGDREVTISACIGAANFPEQGNNSAELVGNCEAALDTAKRRGKGSAHFYQSDLCAETAQRLAIENQLYHAISRNELSVHYQPVISLEDGELLGAEALLRWNNAELGNVPPDQFIAIAEESGMIRPVGDWVLENACATAASWERNGLEPLRVAINISSRQFDDSHILSGVRRALEASQLPAERLELEITEGLLLSDSEQTLEAILQLKHMGARLILDDFGTGYSSLSYIKRFPFDGLKIDRCFVRDLEKQEDQRSLANAIVAMAQSLNLHVVAEGVEELSQRRILKNSGCDAAQGYLYSKPLPAEQFEIWARDYQQAHAAKRAAGVVDEL